MKKLLVMVVFGALMIAPALAINANAALLQIIASGMDLVYDGQAIYDATTPAGGFGQAADADPLDTMVFKVSDGGPPTTVGVLTNNIFADIFIDGVQNIPVAGGMVMTTGPFGGFGFDLLMNGTYGLGLNLSSSLEVVYDGTSLNILGTGVTNDIYAQNLPFGVEIGTPVQISFSANILSPNDVEDDGQFLTYFRSSGSGEVSGPSVDVPEPTTLLLLGLGLFGGAAARRRRR